MSETKNSVDIVVAIYEDTYGIYADGKLKIIDDISDEKIKYINEIAKGKTIGSLKESYVDYGWFDQLLYEFPQSLDEVKFDK